jgi:hypothetical protein
MVGLEIFGRVVARELGPTSRRRACPRTAARVVLALSDWTALSTSPTSLSCGEAAGWPGASPAQDSRPLH